MRFYTPFVLFTLLLSACTSQPRLPIVPLEVRGAVAPGMKGPFGDQPLFTIDESGAVKILGLNDVDLTLTEQGYLFGANDTLLASMDDNGVITKGDGDTIAIVSVDGRMSLPHKDKELYWDEEGKLAGTDDDELEKLSFHIEPNNSKTRRLAFVVIIAIGFY